MSTDVIDGYELKEIVGHGSTSIVFRARDRHARRVAVKILRSDALSEDLQRRFVREANLRIDHPNVVRTLDAGIARTGTPYIVLELLEGTDLEERFAAGRPFAPREALDIVRQATRGIAAAHRIGVVHRDIKPGNLFACSDGTVKVLDFGVARFVELASGPTKTGQLLGTLLYFAPEQLAGAKSADERADVWALGMVLYHALAGSAPYARKTPIETALAILHQPLPPLGPRVPTTLAAIAEQCLRKDPAERLPNAIALRAVLEAARV